MATAAHPQAQHAALFLSTSTNRDTRSNLERLEDTCKALWYPADENGRVGARIAQRWLDLHEVPAEDKAQAKREAGWEHCDTSVDALALARAMGY